MKVLYVGDNMGEPGRRAVARAVPRLVSQRNIDVVIGNGENVAGGFGITPELAEELFKMGLSAITTGNHAWDKKEILDYFPRERRLLRPANYPEGVPGQGSVVIRTKSGEEVAVLQLMGRAYMPTLDCPFQVAKREMSRLRKLVAAVIVDMRREERGESHRTASNDDKRRDTTESMNAADTHHSADSDPAHHKHTPQRSDDVHIFLRISSNNSDISHILYIITRILASPVG